MLHTIFWLDYLICAHTHTQWQTISHCNTHSHTHTQWHAFHTHAHTHSDTPSTHTRSLPSPPHTHTHTHTQSDTDTHRVTHTMTRTHTVTPPPYPPPHTHTQTHEWYLPSLTFSISHRVKEDPWGVFAHATFDKGDVMTGLDADNRKQLHLLPRQYHIGRAGRLPVLSAYLCGFISCLGAVILELRRHQQRFGVMSLALLVLMRLREENIY